MAAIGFDSSCQSVYSLPFNNVMFPLTVSQPKYATLSRMQWQKSRNFELISKKKMLETKGNQDKESRGAGMQNGRANTRNY